MGDGRHPLLVLPNSELCPTFTLDFEGTDVVRVEAHSVRAPTDLARGREGHVEVVVVHFYMVDINLMQREGPYKSAISMRRRTCLPENGHVEAFSKRCHALAQTTQPL